MSRGRSSHGRLLELSSASGRGVKVIISTISCRPRMVAESIQGRKRIKRKKHWFRNLEDLQSSIAKGLTPESIGASSNLIENKGRMVEPKISEDFAADDFFKCGREKKSSSGSAGVEE